MTKAAEITKRLLSVLSEEERLYVEMKSLLQEERGYMASRDVDMLEGTVARKQALANEGRLLEECRQKVMRELGEEFGLPEGETTISRLCTLLGDDDRGLRNVHGRMVSLVAGVRELLEANANFAGEALNRVQSTLRLLGRLLPDQPTYDRAPSRKAQRPLVKPGHIVQQAV